MKLCCYRLVLTKTPEPSTFPFGRVIGSLMAGGLMLLHMGCATNWQTAALAAGVTAAGARSPSHEMEQIYYLGVFDPEEQVPPAVYRVKVHGQASMISVAKFASGWVPAQVADSLTSQIEYSDNGIISKQDNKDTPDLLTAGRRMMLFGPEGFREAPRNSRLVIIMGSDPSKYFGAVNDAMGALSRANNENKNNTIVTQILLALTQVQDEKSSLQDLLDQLPAAPKS